MMKIYYIFLCVSFYSCFMYSQISPGELSRAHVSLEGMSNCTKCHVLGEKVYNSKCLDCHAEIKKLINTGKGYHSSAEVKNKDCWNCHSEHNGRNFRIINFDRKKFDHSKTTFQLTGKHKQLKCEDCHQAKYLLEKGKKKTDTFLGLSNDCSFCHLDSHQKTLGSNCSGCHNTESFKPAASFNHDKSVFKLTGAHKEVLCISCHRIENKNGKPFQKFKGVVFSSCQNCHTDVHQGKLGNNCQGCHTTNSFRQVSNIDFNHDKTSYPLVGQHKKVACKNCHKTSITTKIKYEKCTDCHSDYHRGEFTKNGVISDCSLCHTVNGFRPSLYKMEEHLNIRFSLTGGHLAVPCASCHYKNQEWHFKMADIKCLSCHDNIHGTEIVDKYMPDNDCTYCHQTKTWNAITFNHEQTDFRLKGKHLEVNCRNCHYRENGINKGESVFKSLDSKCETCHKDIHAGQFSKQNSTDCTGCHTYNNWNPELFDHNKTRFPIEGAHKKLECSSCHKKTEIKGNSFIKYKMEDFKCAACHS